MAYGCRRRRGGASLGWERAGQSTLEYALVLSAFLAMVIALGALWHAASDGTLLSLATQSASHSLEQGTVAFLKDVVGY